MNIAVLVCDVIDHSIPLINDTMDNSIWNKCIYHKINNVDLISLEVAINIKLHSNSNITSMTLGSESSIARLKMEVAPQTDKTVLIVDNEDNLRAMDSNYAADILGTLLGKNEWDLILCGVETSDYGGGITGPIISKILNYEFIGGVVDVMSVNTVKNTICVKRKGEWGKREIIEVKMPAVIAFTEGEVEPKRPLLSKKMSIPADCLEIIPVDNIQYNSSTSQSIPVMKMHKVKPRGIFIPDSSLSTKDRIKSIMEGGLKKKKGEIIEGGGENAVKAIIEFVKEINAISF